MQLGRYKILSELGKGGMASVFLGEDPNLNRLVAVKVIQAHLTEDSNLLKRFTEEAKTAACLRSPNILEIYDYGVQDNQPFIVMEYLDSCTLQFICSLQEGKPLPPEVAAAIMCQASDGLAVAAKNGVVHRDIKPENLMFNSEGQLKITDFGIAHLAGNTRKTATGIVLGSPNFMAPEQIEGLKPTFQTDMWAMGAVLYFCLTGVTPFSGNTITATLRNICDKPFKPIPESVSSINPFLYRLVEILLQKKPEDRGDGARWLSAELKAFLTKKGIIDLQEYSRKFINSLNIQNNTTIIENATPTPSDRFAFSSHAGRPVNSASKLIRKSDRKRSVFARPLTWISLFLIMLMAGAVGVYKYWLEFRTQTTPQRPSVQNVVLTPLQLELLENEEKPLTAIVFPTGADTALSWSTSDAKTAEVEMGMVKGIRAGECVITVFSKSDSSKVAVSYIHVKAKKPEPVPAKPIRRVRKRKAPPKKPVPSATPMGSQPEVRKKGSIRITSSPPFARIKFDGKNWGETPMPHFREVEAGIHSIELIHRLYPPMDTLIEVEAGTKRVLRCRLE